MATKIKLNQLADGTSGQMIEVNGSGVPEYVNKNSVNLSEFNNDLTINDYFSVACAHGATVQFTSGATVYWSNWHFAASSLRSTAGQSLTTIPFNSTLTHAVITTWNAAGSITQTASTVYFRLAGSDNVISNSVLWSTSAATPVQHVVTNLNVAVTAGQTFEIKLVMGSLATPPTSSAQCTVVLYFKRTT